MRDFRVSYSYIYIYIGGFFGNFRKIGSDFGFFIKPGPGSGFFNPYPILFLIRPDKIRLIKVGPDQRVGQKLSSYL